MWLQCISKPFTRIPFIAEMLYAALGTMMARVDFIQRVLKDIDNPFTQAFLAISGATPTNQMSTAVALSD